MSYTARYRQGNVKTGDYDLVFEPRVKRAAGLPGVLLMHGADNPGQTHTGFYGPGFPEAHKLAAVLAAEGIASITAYFGGNTYANNAICDTGVNDYMNKAVSFLSSEMGTSATQAHVFGVSMGGGCAARWASLNPTKAASVAGVIPMTDLIRIFRENPNLNGGSASFTYGIAQAWGLTAVNLTNVATTNGSPTITSAGASFTSAYDGRYITRGYTQTAIPVDTTVTFVNSTTLTMSKNATATTTNQVVTISDPLPITGTAGADLIGVHAPRLLSNSIPNRWFYASDDPYILPSKVTDFATAAGGDAINVGATGHDNDALVVAAAYNGGTDWSDYVEWILAQE